MFERVAESIEENKTTRYSHFHICLILHALQGKKNTTKN